VHLRPPPGTRSASLLAPESSGYTAAAEARRCFSWRLERSRLGDGINADLHERVFDELRRLLCLQGQLLIGRLGDGWTPPRGHICLRREVHRGSLSRPVV
jgi:hypothetical protein